MFVERFKPGSTAVRHRMRQEGHAVFADAAIVFFAVWTVLEHAAVYFGLSFEALWMIAWPASLAAIAVSIRLAFRQDSSCVPGDHDPENQRTWVWLAALIAVVFTLCLHRPDADDQCYLGLTATALDYASAPIASLQQWSNCPAGYALTSFEFLRAGFSWLTGTPVLVSYYLVWPGLIAILVVAVYCDLFRLVAVRNLALAWVVFFVVMLAWGDAHRTPSNFGLVRLFQGKSALIWVTIPAALCHWLRFVEHADRKSLLLLFCSIVAGTGFSPTGVPTGVLLAGVFLAATFVHRGFQTSNRLQLLGVAAMALYPVVIGMTMRSRFTHDYYGVVTDRGIRTTVWNSEMLEYALGHNLRGLLALLCAAALPLLLRPSPARRLLSIYSGICTLLLLFPWTSDILGVLSFGSFAWRWLFAIPFALSLIVAADRVVDCFRPAWTAYLMVGVMMLAYVAPSTRWVLSKQNHASLRAPGFKIPDRHGVHLRPYGAFIRIDDVWLISPETGRRL